MRNYHNEGLIGRAKAIFCVVVGNALYALAVKLFLLPAGLITGGTTGIALIANKMAGIPVSGFVLGFNILMLIVGFWILGRAFALTTLASTFLYPMFLSVFDLVFGDFILTDDLLLCTIFTGLGIGISLGLVIRAGASTGGMDIPPLVLRKLFRVSVSGSMYVFDVCILLAQAVFQPIDRLLYGILLVMIYTIVLDKMMLLGSTRTEIRVISKYTEEIRSAIINQLDRGVTLLDGQGGFEGKELQMIFSVISNRELPRMERLIHQIDPECFMTISRVSEVRGHGFSMKKEYKSKEFFKFDQIVERD